jgi:hypothetical protein
MRFSFLLDGLLLWMSLPLLLLLLLLFLLPLQSLCPEERDGRWRRCCPGGWIGTNPPVLLAGHRRRVVVVDAESAATSRRGRRSRPRRVVPPRLLVAFAPSRRRLEFHIAMFFLWSRSPIADDQTKK